MTTIVIDDLNEEDFRRSIENRLREGRASAALDKLRSLIAPYAGSGGILPERFLTVEAADLVLSGWGGLSEAVQRHDQPGRPVTALSITFGWPGDETPKPDAEGKLRPHLETSYFSDNAYPFSQSGREDLLEGYSFYGCTWNGDCEAIDTTLSLEGIDELHGALASLEARLLASEEPDEESICAGSLGACLLSTLLVQAVTERISRDGLPRPLCVMAGSNSVYPYFDAPVVGMPEDARKAADEEPETVDLYNGAPAPRYSSLLMTGIPRAKKRAVLVLDESADELANRISRLRSLNHADAENAESEREDMAAVPAPEMPDLMAATAGSGSLLAQKPARQARDLHDMLGLSTLDRSADNAPPSEPVDWKESVDWTEAPASSELDSWHKTPAQPEPDDWPELPVAPGSIDWPEAPASSEPVGWHETPAQPEPDDWPELPVAPGSIDWHEPPTPAEPVEWPEPPAPAESADWHEEAEWPERPATSESVEWPEPVHWPDTPAAAKPALPPLHGKQPVEPGFTLLEADPLQRWQDLLMAEPPPIVGAPWLSANWQAGHSLEEARSAATPVDSIPAEPAAEPTPVGLRARLRGRFKTFLARLGR